MAPWRVNFEHSREAGGRRHPHPGIDDYRLGVMFYLELYESVRGGRGDDGNGWFVQLLRNQVYAERRS